MNSTESICINLQQVIKKYHNFTAVNGIDLTIQKGECFGLLGPNGAGKTTTLRMILGLTPPTSGNITVMGFSIPDQAREMRYHVGVVPQFDNLDPDFSVRENLVAYAEYFGFKPNTMQTRIDELLDFVQLSERAAHPLRALSGGMKRRLTLARALINQPSLIILDEPSTGLDPQARQHIWARLRQLKEQGVTLILTTHYMDEAERLCDRLAIVDQGQIQAIGAPRSMINTHLEAHVIEFPDEISPEYLSQWRTHPELRVECPGSSTFIYAQSRDVLLSAVNGIDQHYLYRPTNLEDLFLKLTGRDLRD